MSATSSEEANLVDARSGSWTIEQPANWLVVPSTTTDRPDAVVAWEREATESVYDTLLTDYVEDDRTTKELAADDHARLRADAAGAVAGLREFADSVAPSGRRVVALLGVRDRGPIPVLVAVGTRTPDEPDDFMKALGATGGNPTNPPNIEYPDLPDGDGVRVTRTDIGPGGALWVTVTIGRRTEYPDLVVDTLLVWSTRDFFVVPDMVDALEEILPAVKITRSET